MKLPLPNLKIENYTRPAWTPQLARRLGVAASIAFAALVLLMSTFSRVHGMFDWVPSISYDFRWWHAAAPVGFAALVAIGLAWRTRRRRRRGFYMPQTKLRLPVR